MHRKKKLSGFTIVELLIVVVVIAILAAISVVAYTGIQSRAINMTVEADAASIIKKMEMAKIDLGFYPRSNAQFPDGFKFSKSAYNTSSGSNVFYCLNRDEDRYAFGFVSKGSKRWIVSEGTVSEVPNAGTAAVCATVGKTWSTSDPTVVTITGYYSSASEWNASWKWTN